MTRGRIFPVFFSIVVLKVARVDVRHQWRFQGLAEHLIPVNIAKPRVLHDLSDALVAHDLVLFEHVAEEVFYFSTQEWLIQGEISIDDVIKHAGMIIIEKRRKARYHFVQKDAEAVDVKATIVPFTVLEHLGAEVLRRATERVGALVL